MSSPSESSINFVYPDPATHHAQYSVLDVVNVSWSTDLVDQVAMLPGATLQLSLLADTGNNSQEHELYQSPVNWTDGSSIRDFNFQDFNPILRSKFHGRYALSYRAANGSISLKTTSNQFAISDHKSAGTNGTGCCRNCVAPIDQNGIAFAPCKEPNQGSGSSNSNNILPIVIGLGCSIIVVTILLFITFLFIRRREAKKRRVADMKLAESVVDGASLSRGTMSLANSWGRSPSKKTHHVEADCELSTHEGPYELLGRGKDPQGVREWLMETDIVPRLSRPGKAHTVVGARNLAQSVRSNRSLPLPPRLPRLHYTEALVPGTPTSAPPRSFTR